MPKHNARNERIKREYLVYLKEAKRLSETSIDGVAAALHRFEAYTGYRDFRQFHIQQAIGFKRHLAQTKNERTGRPLSKSTMHTTLAALKAFFQWLAGRPGYKSRLSYADAEYFNLTDKEVREAKAYGERPVPTIDQVRHVVQSMPVDTEVELRNRALVAFALLSGARDSALASFKLKHVDLDSGRVFQDAREVRTKNSKTFTSSFFPVGSEFRDIVEEWITFLRTERLWGDDDPLFPATEVRQGNDLRFRAKGLSRTHWSTASPIRDIFRKAFVKADLPYFNPHSLRKTLARLGERLCQNAEQWQAWCQNLGHEHAMTTFTSYGKVEPWRQAEIFQSFEGKDDADSDMAEVVAHMRKIVARYPKKL